jgi:hypothetical protein
MVSLRELVNALGKQSTVERRHPTLEFDRQGVAFSVNGFANGHTDPAFADAVLLHIKTLLVIEANANAMLKNSGIMVRATGVNRQVIGQFGPLCRVGHGCK